MVQRHSPLSKNCITNNNGICKHTRNYLFNKVISKKNNSIHFKTFNTNNPKPCHIYHNNIKSKLTHNITSLTKIVNNKKEFYNGSSYNMYDDYGYLTNHYIRSIKKKKKSYSDLIYINTIKLIDYGIFDIIKSTSLNINKYCLLIVEKYDYPLKEVLSHKKIFERLKLKIANSNDNNTIKAIVN